MSLIGDELTDYTEEELKYNINDNLIDLIDLDDKINNVKHFLDSKKEYKLNYENELDLNKDLYNTRLGILNNIKLINNYNKKLIMTLIAILFAIIISITSVVVLNNR